MLLLHGWLFPSLIRLAVCSCDVTTIVGLWQRVLQATMRVELLERRERRAAVLTQVLSVVVVITTHVIAHRSRVRRHERTHVTQQALIGSVIALMRSKFIGAVEVHGADLAVPAMTLRGCNCPTTMTIVARMTQQISLIVEISRARCTLPGCCLTTGKSPWRKYPFRWR